MRVCIYTAIYGGYDDLKPAATQSIPTDFFCIHPKSPWRIVRNLDRPDLSARLRAKWFKMHPHLLFPNGAPRRPWWAILRPNHHYDVTIWIDGSLEITSPNFAADMLAQLGPAGLSAFPHPARDCIYEELEKSLRWAKYAGQALSQQVESYRQQGYPPHHGLAAAGVLVRNPKSGTLAALDEARWQENLRWSPQDQLSLPVVWWRAGLRHNVIQGHLWQNPWFRHTPHPHEEGLIATPAVSVSQIRS